jgi:hypothetical protein
VVIDVVEGPVARRRAVGFESRDPITDQHLGVGATLAWSAVPPPKGLFVELIDN